MKAPREALTKRAVPCTFCKKPYIQPCHGKNAACENRRHIERKGKRK